MQFSFKTIKIRIDYPSSCWLFDNMMKRVQRIVRYEQFNTIFLFSIRLNFNETFVVFKLKE